MTVQKCEPLPWAWRLVGCESSWRSNILPKDSVWDCQIWLRKPATSGLSGFIALRFIADLAGATQPLPLQSVCWSLHAVICHRAIGIRMARRTFRCGPRRGPGAVCWLAGSLVDKVVDPLLPGANSHSLAPEPAARGCIVDIVTSSSSLTSTRQLYPNSQILKRECLPGSRRTSATGAAAGLYIPTSRGGRGVLATSPGKIRLSTQHGHRAVDAVVVSCWI